MGMKEQDKNKRLKNNLKNSRAKIKRRDEKIAQLEADAKQTAALEILSRLLRN